MERDKRYGTAGMFTYFASTQKGISSVKGIAVALDSNTLGLIEIVFTGF